MWKKTGCRGYLAACFSCSDEVAFDAACDARERGVARPAGLVAADEALRDIAVVFLDAFCNEIVDVVQQLDHVIAICLAAVLNHGFK